MQSAAPFLEMVWQVLAYFLLELKEMTENC